MPTSRRTLLKTSAAAAAAFSLDWTRAQAQAETVRIGLIYDSDRAVCRGRVGRLLDRRADCHRPRQREGRRRRQVQDRPYRRRFPEQARRGDQRGQSPDRPGEDRHHQRRLCELARGPARRQGRAAEKDPLDHDRGFDRRVQGQEPAIRLPRADPLRPVRPGLCGLHQPNTPRPSSAWSPRTSRSR